MSTGPHDPDGNREVHPGWAQQSPEAYAAGHSGGWGSPGGADTGPLRLTPPPAATPPVSEPPVSELQGLEAQTLQAQTPGARSTGDRAPAPLGDGAHAAPRPPADAHPAVVGAAVPPPGPGLQAAAPGDPASLRPPYAEAVVPPPYAGHPAPQAHGPRDGLGAILDFSFTARATRALAPLLFWLVVAWGVIDLIYTVVAGVTGRPFIGGGTVFVGFLLALLDVLVKIALARLFLELAVNVSDLAERRRHDR